MPTLHLAPPTLDDIEPLLAFEVHNRAYFEAHINARPASYYSAEGVAQAITLATLEAQLDKGYQYLVRDSAGQLVARINLSRVRRAHYHCADLGYRVAQTATGQGVASEAVRQVLALAFGPHRLVRLEATARPENPASVQVLGRNGFKPFGRTTQSFELHGAWYDLLHFDLRA